MHNNFIKPGSYGFEKSAKIHCTQQVPYTNFPVVISERAGTLLYAISTKHFESITLSS